jgi:hypothetical protein
MVILKNKLENLKPGRQYLLSVRSKNADLNVLSGYTDTIRFEVPADSTIPDALTSLKIYSGLENVMFVFDYSENLDIDGYEYQLYENEDMSDEDGPLTGFADANVFTVRVTNLRLEEDGEGLWPYWGRVRAIDTSGNVGPWTPLTETDPHTPLIDNQYIGSLTVSKLTAGTIGAHTINLNGANSIIQSTTYLDTSGTQGWQIRGDGHFSLGGPNGITYDNESISIGSDVSVTATLSADSITVGTAPNQLKINDAINGGAGGMTIGDPTYNHWYSNGQFRTGNATNYVLWNGTSLTIRGILQFEDGTTPGDFNAGDPITGGSIAGLTISPTKMYIGTGTFDNANTAFYVDNTGKFSLKDQLSWNGNTLTIGGNAATSLITGGQVNSNVTAISGGVITTGTINLGVVNVQTGSSGARLQINSTGIKAYNSSGTNTVSIGSDGAASFTGTITATQGSIAGWTIGPDALYVGLNSLSGTSYINTLGGAWFSAGVIAPSFSGYGAPSTTGGATNIYTTTVIVDAVSQTRGYLRNISYGSTKPSSAVLGDIHFS